MDAASARNPRHAADTTARRRAPGSVRAAARLTTRFRAVQRPNVVWTFPVRPTYQVSAAPAERSEGGVCCKPGTLGGDSAGSSSRKRGEFNERQAQVLKRIGGEPSATRRDSVEMLPLHELW
jgi:hypothetical protein